MQTIFGQLRQLVRRIGQSKSPVGINSQGELFRPGHRPDFGQNSQLGVKIQAPNFQLEAGVTGRQFLLNLLAHEAGIAHPY